MSDPDFDQVYASQGTTKRRHTWQKWFTCPTCGLEYTEGDGAKIRGVFYSNKYNCAVDKQKELRGA